MIPSGVCRVSLGWGRVGEFGWVYSGGAVQAFARYVAKVEEAAGETR
jgi:hypothetical protein